MKKTILFLALSISFLNSNARCFFYHIVVSDTIIDGWSDLTCADFKPATGIETFPYLVAFNIRDFHSIFLSGRKDGNS